MALQVPIALSPTTATTLTGCCRGRMLWFALFFEGFDEKIGRKFGGSDKSPYFCIAIEKISGCRNSSVGRATHS